MEAEEYKTFLYSVPMGYAHHKVIYDDEENPTDYIFLEANNEFTKITGLDNNIVIGKKISEVLPELLNANFDWVAYYGNIAKRMASSVFEQYSEPLHKWFRVYVTSMNYGYFTTLFTDITESKKNYQELNTKKNLVTILLELSQHINDFNLDELIEKTLDFAEEQTNSKIAFYHFVEKDQITISIQTWSSNTVQNMCKALGKGTHYSIEEAGIWADSLRQQSTIVVNDYSNVKNKKGLPEGHAPVRNFISMPVISERQVKAVIGVGNKDGDYTQEDVSILKEISQTLWNLISHKRIELKLNEAHKRLEIVLDNIDTLIYIADINNYEILFINKYGKRIWGDNIIGKKCWDKIQLMSEPCPFCSNKFLMDKNNKPAGVYQWEFLNAKDNQWYDIHDTLIEWSDGRLVKLSIATDITKRKLAEESLKQIANNLQLQNDTKDRFFSIISHDLRNPLGSFKQITSLLHDDYDTFSDEDRLEFLDALKSSSNNVYNLLENLLEWSRSQRGLISFNPTLINIYDLVDKIFEVLAQSAANKQIRLVNLLPDNLIINVDKNLMNTVIRNLCSNSIKFSLAGSQVEIGRIDGNNHTIYIKDYGVGMDDEKLNKLFIIDKNVSTMGTAREKGTGLGLILCKEFIEKHNGKIRVESKLNEGTTFFIELPN